MKILYKYATQYAKSKYMSREDLIKSNTEQCCETCKHFTWEYITDTYIYQCKKCPLKAFHRLFPFKSKRKCYESRKLSKSKNPEKHFVLDENNYRKIYTLLSEIENRVGEMRNSKGNDYRKRHLLFLEIDKLILIIKQNLKEKICIS